MSTALLTNRPRRPKTIYPGSTELSQSLRRLKPLFDQPQLIEEAAIAIESGEYLAALSPLALLADRMRHNLIMTPGLRHSLQSFVDAYHSFAQRAMGMETPMIDLQLADLQKGISSKEVKRFAFRQTIANIVASMSMHFLAKQS